MSTSEQHQQGGVAVAREAAIAVLIVLAMSALVAPRDLGLLGPHPNGLWAAVLILSARYGTRGLVVSLPMAWSGMAIATLCLHGDLGRVAARMTSGSDLGALVVSVLVAWVASMHERRRSEVAARLGALEALRSEEQVIMEELQRAAVGLRTRVDRLDSSLAFLRDVAQRLDGTDAAAAARAALELAMARSGARAGVVRSLWEGRPRTVAWRGAWTADAPLPPDLLDDRTAHAACAGRPVCAADLSGPRPFPERGLDSDMAAPVLDDAGGILGVLSLRGVPDEVLTQASLQELSVIARWCGRSFEVQAAGIEGRGPEGTNDDLPSVDVPDQAARSLSGVS